MVAKDLPEPLDVIAVGAHPDDVEIGCGGWLAKLVHQGYRVGIVDLTNGEPTPGSPGADVRLAEAAEAARILGVHHRELLNLPNRCLFDGFGPRIALARVFRTYRPKLVIGIADRTPMASPDHWQARQIIDAAVFYSRLSKWDDEFAGLPVHSISKQLWYPLGLQSLDLPTGGGRFIADITGCLEQKLAAIRAYATQFPVGKQRVFGLVEGEARLFGASAGFEAGELLISATLLGLKDVMGSLVE